MRHAGNGEEVVVHFKDEPSASGLRGIKEEADDFHLVITTLAGASAEPVNMIIPWSSVRYVRTLLAEERAAPIDYSSKGPA